MNIQIKKHIEIYIFIYEYGDYGEKQCITRINRDGSNPILVMDENGEVVMEPVQ